MCSVCGPYTSNGGVQGERSVREREREDDGLQVFTHGVKFLFTYLKPLLCPPCNPGIISMHECSFIIFFQEKTFFNDFGYENSPKSKKFKKNQMLIIIFFWGVRLVWFGFFFFLATPQLSSLFKRRSSRR